MRYYRFVQELSSTSPEKKKKAKTEMVDAEMRDIFWHDLEVCLESAPQLALQLSIVFLDPASNSKQGEMRMKNHTEFMPPIQSFLVILFIINIIIL